MFSEMCDFGLLLCLTEVIAVLWTQNLIFRFLQSKARIQIWLFEHNDFRIEGRIIGFDEYMNIVLEDVCVNILS